MNGEYYTKLNRDEQCILVKHILFNDSYPGGLERTIFKATYGRNGMFTYKRAKRFTRKLVRFFNSKKFQNQKPVYKERI